ncbi:hypothetical protein EFE41_02260 [Methanohalophilus portucalensis FDF-1]|nr:hypothetical protein BKM01_06260 [Methanohalophilus portucalensis]OJH49750.1 hypothetical protein MPF_0538 [Methanohalophilus portucalensis FDF-1]RNI13422.1 hypothetical protein EFE41_02260 [Methanohalophilus portucalensis FDF-1]
MQKLNDESKSDPPNDSQRRKNMRDNWIIILVLFSLIAYGCVDIVTESDDEIATNEAQVLAEEKEEEAQRAEEEAKQAEKERLQEKEINTFEKEMEGILAEYGYSAGVYIDPNNFACCYMYSPIYSYELEQITKGMVKGLRNMETVNVHTVYM